LAEAGAAGGDCTWPFRPDAATSKHGSLTTASNGGIALDRSDETLPRYPTVYPPSLPTQLVHAFRTIARISHQLLRTHLRRRLGQQMASCPFVITPAQARGHADCELPFRHCAATGQSAHGTGTSCHTPSAAKPGHRPSVVDPARLVVGTAGSRFPNRDIALASLTSASPVVGTAGVDSPNRDIALASLTSASPVVGTTGGRFSTGGIP
jgi:hypothetical protein